MNLLRRYNHTESQRRASDVLKMISWRPLNDPGGHLTTRAALMKISYNNLNGEKAKTTRNQCWNALKMELLYFSPDLLKIWVHGLKCHVFFNATWCSFRANGNIEQGMLLGVTWLTGLQPCGDQSEHQAAAKMSKAKLKNTTKQTNGRHEWCVCVCVHLHI